MKVLTIGAVIIGLLFTGIYAPGCKKEEPKPAAVKTSPVAPGAAVTPAAEDPAIKEAQAALDKVSGLVNDGKLDAAHMELTALEAKANVLPPDMQAKVTACRATLEAAKATAGAAATAKDAQEALDKVAALVKDRKFDAADMELKALEAKADTLSPEMQAQIKASRATLTAAKATAEAATAASAAATAAAAADGAAKDAQESLDKVAALVKDGKLDEAELALKDLEAKAGTLSPEMQAQIKASRASLDAAKVAAAAENETLLEKIVALIKSGKVDDAQKLLTDLESKASMLPAPMQEKIKATRSALDLKKAASAVKLPGFGN